MCKRYYTPSTKPRAIFTAVNTNKCILSFNKSKNRIQTSMSRSNVYIINVNSKPRWCLYNYAHTYQTCFFRNTQCEINFFPLYIHINMSIYHKYMNIYFIFLSVMSCSFSNQYVLQLISYDTLQFEYIM